MEKGEKGEGGECLLLDPIRLSMICTSATTSSVASCDTVCVVFVCCTMRDASDDTISEITRPA